MSVDPIVVKNRPFAVASHISSVIDGMPSTRRHEGFDLPVVDPSTGTQISALREADASEVDLAVEAARRAFDEGPWPRMDVDRRNTILYSIRDVLLAHADELAYLEVLHTGLPIASVRKQVERTAQNFQTFAEIASTLSGQTYTQAANFLTYVTREPKGVGALIAPWNAPLALASMRVATCVAFGNTCVLKPSEYTPLSMLRMVELFHEAGLPPGVVNLVNGRGAITGASLVGHPDIDMVGFTGGTTTGRAIMSAAAANLKPCILELGGKSANIVFDSADPEQALDGSLLNIYANNGQMCLAGSRILVQRTIAESFIARFVERARAIRIGDPMDDRTQMGPIAQETHMRRVLDYVAVARDEGATILTGGGRTEGRSQGFYIDPIAVLAPSSAARVCQEEIFGPFATFVVFDTIDDAIRIANDSSYGLVAYVWSQDLNETMRCSRSIRAGVIWVNTPLMRELRAPFGGYKQSGIGRDGATSSADFFTELKTTSIPVQPVAMPKLGGLS